MYSGEPEQLGVFYNSGSDQQGQPILKRVGSLQRQGRNYVFSYCEQAPIDVSVTMPRRQQQYSFAALHPIFQMNLPEGLPRDLLNHAQNKAAGSGTLQVLLELTESYARLQYQRESGNAEQGKQVFAELIGKYTASKSQARTQQFINSSIMGKSVLPNKFEILKSWGNEYPELACNEYACLQVARAFGIPTVEAELVATGKSLSVKRFDVTANHSAPLLGFEDFCVLQGKLPAERYASSYELCAKSIRHFVSPRLQLAALRNFFKMLLLSCCIRNGDAHLKNFGILYHEGGERDLAPCFDLSTTTVYLASDFMALALNGSKQWPTFAELSKFGIDHCALAPKDMPCLLSELGEALAAGSHQLATMAQQRESFANIAQNMHAIWSASYSALI